MLTLRWIGEKTRTATYSCDNCGKQEEQRLHENTEMRPPNEWPMLLGKGVGEVPAHVEALCCSDACLQAWKKPYAVFGDKKPYAVFGDKVAGSLLEIPGMEEATVPVGEGPVSDPWEEARAARGKVGD